jgi:denticleless
MVDFNAHNNAIFDVAWMPTEAGKMATVSGDLTVRLWDIVNSDEVTMMRKFHGSAYTRSIKCVEFAPGNPNLVATGDRDNAILMWDIREPSDTRPALAIRRAHTHSSSGGPSGVRGNAAKKSASSADGYTSSVTAIQFQDEHRLVSSSDTDGLLKVWDFRRSYDRYKGEPQAQHYIPYPGKSALHGYTSLVLNSSMTHVYASCKDNQIYLFDLASYSDKPVTSYGGYENGCKYFIRMSLSCDDKYLACGSSDDAAYIWNTSPYAPRDPVYKLTGHESEVTCVDWSKDGWRLATCSDDMKHRIWRMRGDQELERNDIHGEAERLENVPYHNKLQFKVSKFNKNDIENIGTEQQQQGQSAKKRRLRSPLKPLPTTPQKQVKLAKFPCSSLMHSNKIMSPRKSVLPSPRKLLISPRKLFSPTANLPNYARDGTSPHQPNTTQSGKKRSRVDWLTSLRQQQRLKVVKTPEIISKPEALSQESVAKKTPKRNRAKKSLDMNKA